MRDLKTLLEDCRVEAITNPTEHHEYTDEQKVAITEAIEISARLNEKLLKFIK